MKLITQSKKLPSSNNVRNAVYRSISEAID